MSEGSDSTSEESDSTSEGIENTSEGTETTREKVRRQGPAWEVGGNYSHPEHFGGGGDQASDRGLGDEASAGLRLETQA